MAGSLQLVPQEERAHLVEPCEVSLPRFSRGARIGAMVLGLSAAVLMLSGASRHLLPDWMDPELRSLEVELQKAGLELPLQQKSHISAEAGTVLCVVDVAQSVGRVMAIGTSIKSVTVNCDFDRIRREQKRPPTSDERQRCAVSIIGILVNTALGIGAMSSSVSTCAGSVNVPANCAANINAFVGNALVLVGTAMAADLSCPAAPIQEQIEDKKEEIEAKKLEVERKVNEFLKKTGQAFSVLPPDPAVPKDVVFTSIARCVAALDLATTFVMKSAVIIADSTVDCAEEELIDEDDKRVCLGCEQRSVHIDRAVNIIGLMGTLSLATRFFALASNSCVQIVGETTEGANCAADIAGINAGVYATVAPAMNLQPACERAFATWDPDTWPSRKELRQSATKQGPKNRVVQQEGYTVIADP